MRGVELFEHQKVALSLMRVNDGFALFMEQGTGKTFPVLFRLAELAEQDRIKSALVVAPKAVCTSWKEKLKLLSDSQRAALESIDLEVASYDFVWRREEIRDAAYDALVLDESHYIKNPAAKRTKACLALASRAKYRYILTGTPTSNGQLCNVWAQFAAVCPVVNRGRVYPEVFGGISYYLWLESVAYLNKYHQPYKYKNVSEIQEAMSALSYRITKEECLDLPEKMPDEILHVGLAHEAVRPYRQMLKSSAIVELDTLAGNPLTRALRLRQLASGFILKDDGTMTEYASPKISALKEFLSDFEGKFVIFCEFHHSIDAVAALLDSMGIGFTTLDGRSKDKGVWKDFQEDPDIRGIVVQYASGSAGIDLYAADTCIFFEPTLSSNLNEQAKDRIHRIGQHRPCSYYYLIADGSIEADIYNALSNYADFGEALFTKYLREYAKGDAV